MKQSSSYRIVFLVAVATGCGDGSSKASPEADAAPSAAGGAANAGGASAGGNTVGSAGLGGTTSSAGGASSGGTTPVPTTGDWTNATANLANMASECGNLSHLSAKPDEDELIAGIAQKGLWGSKNGGASWQQIGTGAGSDTIANRTSSIVFDPAHPATYWESGIYNAGGVYSTTDDGATFHALGSVHHDDLVSVDFGDPNRKTLLAGGHEQTRTLYRSTDGGATWENVGVNLPSGTNFSSVPLVIDAQTHLVGLSGYAGGTSGIFRTTDGGKTWTQVTASGGIGAPLWATNGDIYWASGDGVTKSTDRGKTFNDIPANGLLKASTPIQLPDGRIAMVGSKTLMVSSDGAASFKPASTDLPYGDAVGVTYSSQQKAFFIWHFSCGNTVPADAIMRFDFDYQKN